MQHIQLLYLPQFQFYNMVDNGTHKTTMYHLNKNMKSRRNQSINLFLRLYHKKNTV